MPFEIRPDTNLVELIDDVMLFERHEPEMRAKSLQTIIAEAERRGAEKALLEFAEHIREFWCAAYNPDFFVPVPPGEMDDGLRTRCSFAMGHHVTNRIYAQALQEARAVRETG